MFSSGIGSYHSDVLSAEPKDKVSQENLINELKTRAKNSIKSSNYYDANLLYKKGIDVAESNNYIDKSEISILYSNKSMCELYLNNIDLAITDAEKSVELNPNYIKGYYRLATSLIKQNKYNEAKDSLLKGLSISPNEKELSTQLNKVNELISTNNKPPTTTTSKVTNQSVKSQDKPVDRTVDKTIDKTIDDENEIDLKNVRGYQKTKNGNITTFFNHELDENTKQLIGDITPKKIDIPVTKAIDSTNHISNGSVWNSAGTYEEKIYTTWANERLNSLFINYNKTINISNYSFIFIIEKVSNLIGDAQISIIRSKRKHIYDYSFTLNFILKLNDEVVSDGDINLIDISSSLDSEIFITVKPKDNYINILDNNITSTLKKDIEKDIRSLLVTFDNEFKDK